MARLPAHGDQEVPWRGGLGVDDDGLVSVSMGLPEFDPDKIAVLPFRGDMSKNRTKVRSTVDLDDGSKVPVSGQHFREIISQPVVIDAGEREFKYISGSSGNIQTVDEKGDSSKGRQSWRQIR